MQKELFLIGCSRSKLPAAAAARDLYCSDRFQKCVRVAERIATEWHVLSAQHGLLAPNQRVVPYDSTLRDLAANEIKDWQAKVIGDVEAKTRAGDRVTFLAEDDYSFPLADSLRSSGRIIRLPFQGRARDARMHWLDCALGQSSRRLHLDRLYDLLERLKEGPLGYRTLGSLAEGAQLPTRGVYFFFEPEEWRLGSMNAPRVVRVGTHGVSFGSSSTLWGRLRTHYGTRQGAGNHRSSVMRLHVGNALLARHKTRFFAPTWGSSDSTDLDSELLLEQAVSEYIGAMRVLWIAVPDSPSAHSDRAYIEQNSISLLSGILGPIDVADSQWLGTDSPHPAIRRASLWNVNHVDEQYDPGFLDVLSMFVEGTLGRRTLPASSLAPADWPVRRTEVGQQMLFGNSHDTDDR